MWIRIADFYEHGVDLGREPEGDVEQFLHFLRQLTSGWTAL